MDKNLLLVNVYGPNKDNPQFFSDLKETISRYKNHNIIAVGDWNLVLDPNLDYDNYKHVNNPRATQAVEKMMSDLVLTDVWREGNPECRRFTWRRQTPLQQSRLDFFLLSDYLFWYFEETDILPGYRSDHSMITLRLKFRQEIKPNNFWKFNSSLLKDQDFIKEINTEIMSIIEEYAIDDYDRTILSDMSKANIKFKVSDKVFLDFLLMKIRSKTIAYATHKKRKTKEQENKLIKDIQILEAKQIKTEEDLKILTDKNRELLLLREKHIEGVLLRSKAKWIAEGEKITKYFCNLEKRNYISKRMTKLSTENISITDPNEIKTEVHRFYENLYKQNDNVKDCNISDLIKDQPKLSSEESKSLEGEITLEEASIALKQMGNGKSPGSDGFGPEFFKFFWKDLGPLVVRALNEAFREGELSSTQKQGLVICIPKGDKPREYLKNWRPISLLNTIYKIGSSCIANRLKTVLPSLINEDQTGFVPKRYIGDNIRLIYDVMRYLDMKNKPGLMLSLDFEKAFDSLDWGFMFKVLKSYGFGYDICKWVSTFYNNIKSTVIVNGQCTSWFSVNRGCRQGDPISPYLFILSVEILAIMIRENKDIRGIYIGNIEHKISQFADDAQLLNDGDEGSFEKTIDVIKTFGQISGLFLNAEKTQVIWLGSKKNCQTQFLPHMKLQWNPESFKILGIWFSHDYKECERLNYSEKCAEIRALFKTWLKRSITPLGRVAVLKSIILSKLVYLWILLPNPPIEFVQEFQKVCFQFVWNQKQDRISRKAAVRHVSKGGLGIPDIHTYISALKLMWIRKLKNSQHKWKHVSTATFPFLESLQNFGPDLFLNKDLNKNPFWLDVMKAYKQICSKLPSKCIEEIVTERIMYNNNIIIDNKIITNTTWIRNGVYYIAQVMKENGSFLNHNEFNVKFDTNIGFLTYAACISSIKRYVRKCGFQSPNSNTSAELPTALRLIYSAEKGTRKFYDLMITEEINPNCCAKWDEKLNTRINWKSVFAKIHHIKDIRLRWFQIRIVHRILATNIVLKEMGITENNQCTFCKQERDSIEHFLWRCHHVKLFWNNFKKLLHDKCDIAGNMSLTEKLVLFGTDTEIKTNIVFDLIIILAKSYIYKCKISKQFPKVNSFIIELKYRYKIENFNAKINDCSQKFDRDWIDLKQLFEN